MKLLEKLLFKGPMSLRTYSNALVSVVWILYELVGYLTFLPVKRTRAITLLITGSVFFTGCSKQTPSSDEWGGEEKPSASPAATNGYSMGHSLAGDRHFGMVRGRLLEEPPRQARDLCLVVDLAQRQVTRLLPPELSWNVSASLPAKT